MMRVLVCGSREFNDYELLKRTLNDYNITEIIHGAARGADTLAGRYSGEAGIPVRTFPAEWDLYGNRAGPIRNTRMLREGQPDMVIAFPTASSRGTRDMITQSRKAGVEVMVMDV